MLTKYKLKPCPFCGNEKPGVMHLPAGFVTFDGYDGPWFVIACVKCPAVSPMRLEHEGSVEAWNRRPDDLSPELEVAP